MVQVSHLSRVFNRVGGVAPRDLKITTLFLITGAGRMALQAKYGYSYSVHIKVPCLVIYHLVMNIYLSLH